MNHNKQQSSDGGHDDDAALSDFLASLMDYTPTVTLLLFWKIILPFLFSPEKKKTQSKPFSASYWY